MDGEEDKVYFLIFMTIKIKEIFRIMFTYLMFFI